MNRFATLPLPVLDPHLAPWAAALLTGLCITFLALALAALVRGVARRGARSADVRALARKGLTPEAIAARTGLARDAVRMVIALEGWAARTGTGRPAVPATRKFVPGFAGLSGPATERDREPQSALQQVLARLRGRGTDRGTSLA